MAAARRRQHSCQRFPYLGEIANGRLVALLEADNPGEWEAIHAAFLGGAVMPAQLPG